MLRHPNLLRTLAALALLAVAGCGRSTDDTVSDAGSLPYAESSDAVEPQLGSVEVGAADLSGATAETGPDPADPSVDDTEVSAEVLRRMLDSEQGRQLVVQGFVDRVGIDVEQAECFLDNVSVELIAGLSTGSGPEGSTALAPAAPPELEAALTACGIDPAAMMG